MGADESMVVAEPEADIVPGMEVANGQDAVVETAFERDKGASIHLRLWLAAGEIGQLEKDGKVKIGKDGYDYITHDNVTLAAKRAFMKHGVVAVPSVAEHSKDGNRTELRVRAKFVNVDKPDDFIEVDGIGYGVDSSDKGPGKAYSYAMKYIYMKVLMLNSADDVESSDQKHQPAVTQQALAAEVANVKQTKEAWATTLKSALLSANSIDEINNIHKTNRKELNADDLPQVTFDYFIDLIEERRKVLGGMES